MHSITKLKLEISERAHTERKWRDVRLESVFGVNAEVAFLGREDRF